MPDCTSRAAASSGPQATAAITTELLAGTDPDTVLQLIAGRAGELTAADWTLIAVPAHPTRLGRPASSPSRSASATARTTDHVPRNVTGLTYDIAAELGLRFGPALAMPLGADETLSGVLLAVGTPGSPAFGEDDLELVSTFADQAALAVRAPKALRRNTNLQTFADRDRTARDLI